MCDAAEAGRCRVRSSGPQCAFMRRSNKLAIACGVLAVGVAVALLSRGRSERPSSHASESRQRPTPAHRLATLRASPVTVPDDPVDLPRLLDRIEPVDDEPGAANTEHRERITAEPLFGDDGKTPAAVAAWRPSTKSPPLRALPDAQAGPAGDGVSEDSPSEATPLVSDVLVHQVRKGDTLSALAARYLGSSERFWELFVANRDRLSNPDLLPLGIELRIPQDAPPPQAARRAAPPRTIERPLAPLTHPADL